MGERAKLGRAWLDQVREKCPDAIPYKKFLKLTEEI
jgi:hypothetical protein